MVDSYISPYTSSYIYIPFRAVVECNCISLKHCRIVHFLLFLRALLDFEEAAFSPAARFLVSFFFERDELAFRNGFFMAAAPLATSSANSLAWLIMTARSHGPIAARTLLFFFEAFPNIITAVFAWFQIPNNPQY